MFHTGIATQIASQDAQDEETEAGLSPDGLNMFSR